MNWQTMEFDGQLEGIEYDPTTTLDPRRESVSLFMSNNVRVASLVAYSEEQNPDGIDLIVHNID